MAFQFQASGSVRANPSSATDNSTELWAVLDLAFSETYDAVFGGNQAISGTFAPALGAIAKVRAIAILPVDGQSLVVHLTSAAGTNQQIPLSGPLLLQAQNPGDEFTAISIVGTGRVSWLFGGNVST